MKRIVFFFPVIMVSAVMCNDGSGTNKTDNTPATPASASIGFSVSNIYPHDTAYFTEGLEFHNGELWESSGGDLEASPFPSALGILDLKTGKVTTKLELDKSKHFGEGFTFFKDKLYWLTWKSGIGFVYDAQTLKKIKEFPLPSKEGWGLTHDSANLIMSDGSSNLYYLSPDSLRLLKIVGITDNNGPVPNINELAYVDGFIYANQWLTSYLLKIDPTTGKVAGRLDLSILTRNKAADEDPNWNGVAYDSATKKMMVAGKKWHSIYEIKLNP